MTQRGGARDRDDARIDRLFESLGHLRAFAESLERGKADKAEAVALDAKVSAVDVAKAAHSDLATLKDYILEHIGAEISDLGERFSDQYNAINSRILGIEHALKDMAENDARRGAEIARLTEAIEDLVKLTAQMQRSLAAETEARRAERETEREAQRKRWKRRLHLFAQYSYQAFAGLALLIILVTQGVTGLPQALTALKDFLQPGF